MSEPEQTPEAPVAEGPSHPFAAVLVIFGLLVLVGYGGKESWWGAVPHLIALGMLSWGAYEGLRPKTFERIRKQYPNETRNHWRLNTLLCYVVFPGLLWVILGLPILLHWFRR